MFFTYVGRELRRRRRQAVVVSLGLALGIGLVVTVSALAAGVRTAQSTALHSLYGVGTDVTVTQSASAGTGGPAQFGLNPESRTQEGQRFARDRVFQSLGLQSIPASEIAAISRLNGVQAVSGGLSLTAIHLEGTFARGQDGGFGRVGSQGSPAPAPSVPPVQVNSYTIEGVDATATGVGALTSSEITSGRYLASSDSNAAVAILDQGYAQQHKLAVGSAITIDGTTYTVIGIASAPAGAQSSNVYIPLARAQKIAGAKGMVNRIYVKATSASDIAVVKAEIQKVLPKATVTTAQDLAAQVTGSLASASSMSGAMGTWLSAAALVAAFAVATLLTMGAVGRRVREFGTLKALGWRTRRVVAQVMGEAVAQGILGGILGIGVGVGGAFLVSRLFPTLTATVGATQSGPRLPGPLSQALAGATRTLTVPLHAPLSASLLALAIGLALAGGVLAGALGGWRAARLRPAEALRRVE